MVKFCPTCKKYKETEEFGNNKSREDKLQRECKECCRQHQSKHYHTKRSPKLKETLKEDHKICTSCKQELPLINFKPLKRGRFGVSSNCKPCFNLKWNKYQKETKQQINNFKKRKKEDPLFKIKYCLRLRVNEVLKRNNITKNHSGLKYLGCTLEKYKEHLENQFTENMSWDNHGKIWEIDHILPLNLIQKPKDCYKFFNYKNTQPLLKSENRIKGCKTI